MKRAVLFLLTASCALVPSPPKVCVSPCGMRLYRSDDCAGFKHAEATALRVFTPSVPNACKQLNNWSLTVYPGDTEGGFIDGWGRDVAGLTGCERLYVTIASTLESKCTPRDGGMDCTVWRSLDWSKSAYAHELMHVFQCEHPPGPDGHEDWTARGIWPLIDEANREMHP